MRGSRDFQPSRPPKQRARKDSNLPKASHMVEGRAQTGSVWTETDKCTEKFPNPALLFNGYCNIKDNVF